MRRSGTRFLISFAVIGVVKISISARSARFGGVKSRFFRARDNREVRLHLRIRA